MEVAATHEPVTGSNSSAAELIAPPGVWPPVTSTRPSSRRVAVWYVREVPPDPAGDQGLVRGWSGSAPPDPATRPRAAGRSVAACATRADAIVPAGVHVLVSGS